MNYSFVEFDCGLAADQAVIAEPCLPNDFAFSNNNILVSG
jgi:hypothetical protein